MNRLAPADLEDFYDALAAALDAVPAGSEAAFLARLALVLADELGEPERLRHALEVAARAARD